MEEAIDVPAYMAILAGDGGTRTRGELPDASKREEIGVVVDAELGIPIPRRRDDMCFAHALPPLEFRGQPFDAGLSFALPVWHPRDRPRASWGKGVPVRLTLGWGRDH